MIVLSTRDSAAKWWESADATILPMLRTSTSPEHEEWRQMVHELWSRGIGPDWDDAAQAQAFYERHNEQVRREALRLPVPDEPFPRLNTREEWLARSER